MPVKKVGNKWKVKDVEYESEDAANKAYMAYLDAAMGVKPEPKKKSTDRKKKVEEDEEE